MTRRAAIYFAAGAAAAAIAGATLTARAAVGLLEARVVAQVGAALGPADEWLELSASGTILTIGGSAPDRAQQIASLARIGTVSGGISILDETLVASERESEAVTAPLAELSLELLSSDEMLTVFGAVPEADRDAVVAALRLPAEVEISNMLETAEGRIDPRWGGTLDLALSALAVVGNGRVSATPGTATVTASATSEFQRAEWLVSLNSITPEGITLSTDIQVPRQIVSPYVFRARMVQGGGLDILACTAETQETATRMSQLHGADAGAEACTIGLGAPSAEWEGAVVASLDAIERLGGGTLDMADADIAITGPQGHSTDAFAAVIDALSDQLPQGFSLSGSLPPPQTDEAEAPALEPPRFTAVRTEDGAVRIRGDVNDTQMQETATTLAEAKFGFNTVINETQPRAELPPGWAANIVGGLEALGGLTMGNLEVTEGALTLTGAAANLALREQIEAGLASRVTNDVEVILDVWEAEALVVEPLHQIPAELCAEQIDLILASATIIFPPSETDIDATSLPIVDRIAEVLGNCPGARFEIGGHTDSQGRESSNMALSQARADAVLAALLERNVDTVFLLARGFGESDPVADNETEDGRARNRRIAFRLIKEPPAEQDGAGAGEVLQAATDDAEVSVIDTARRESPTTIVVPPGTDPASVLPPAALLDEEAEADTAADGDEAGAAEPGAVTLETAVATAVDAAPSVPAQDAAAPPLAADVIGAGGESTASAPSPGADGADAAVETPAPEQTAEVTPEVSGETGADQPDVIRPMPRRGNLPGAGD